MSRHATTVIAGTLLIALTTTAAAVIAQGAGRLEVTVEYTGAGQVDRTHRLFVWAFETPDITADSVPVATDAIAANRGSVQLTGLPAQVYLVVAFDEQGNYDGTAGPPPAGTPVHVHGEHGVARPVRTGGAGAAVTLRFDDATRMP